MGVKDPDVFMALAELSDQLIARRLAVCDGLFAVVVEAEGIRQRRSNYQGLTWRVCALCYCGPLTESGRRLIPASEIKAFSSAER
jgi:hypothetical protein